MIDTAAPQGRFNRQVLGTAEFGRAFVRKRTRAGLAHARVGCIPSLSPCPKAVRSSPTSGALGRSGWDLHPHGLRSKGQGHDGCPIQLFPHEPFFVCETKLPHNVLIKTRMFCGLCSPTGVWRGTCCLYQDYRCMTIRKANLPRPRSRSGCGSQLDVPPNQALRGSFNRTAGARPERDAGASMTGSRHTSTPRPPNSTPRSSSVSASKVVAIKRPRRSVDVRRSPNDRSARELTPYRRPILAPFAALMSGPDRGQARCLKRQDRLPVSQ